MVGARMFNLNGEEITTDISDSRESESISLIRIYPNPTNGEFTIDTPRETDVTIINALGQVIILQHLNEGKNKIDLNGQAKGIYFVQMKQLGKLISNKKIIKAD